MADTTIDLLKNSSYVGKMDELIAAVKLGGSATSDVEWDNVKNKPTTIGGYGIIDAKIDNGTITLGNQTITPLTSAPVTSVNSKTGAVTLSATDVSAIPSTLTGTAGQVLTKTADGQEWKDVDIPTALPNPNALTFTGAVTGSYDGSEPLTVNIPSSGGGEFETILDLTLEEDVNKVVLMSGDVGYKKIVVYMESVPPTDQTVTSNQAISIYSGETVMTDATAKLNGAYLHDGTRRSGVSIELTPYAANIFASGSTGWYDTGAPTAANMGYSSQNSLSKPIKKLTAQVWGSALFGVGSWFKVYGVRV